MVTRQERRSCLLPVHDFTADDSTGSRGRHMSSIREYLQITPYNETTHQQILEVMNTAAHTKDGSGANRMRLKLV